MGAMNFRNGYQFDPDDYDGQNAGGLLGLLQTAMQQRQEQLGAEYGSAPDRAGGSGGSQGGLIGRLAALQAEQAPYQPYGQNHVVIPVAPPDPNFRQLVREPAPARSAVDGYDGHVKPSYVSFQADGSAGGGAQYPTQAPQSRGESLGAYIDSSMPSFDKVAPTKMAQIPIPVRPWWLPPPPPDGLSTPTAPDWLQSLWTLLRKRGGHGGGGRRAGSDYDDYNDSCEANRAREEGRCYKRYEFDPVHPDYLPACRTRAIDRWGLCNKTGQMPDVPKEMTRPFEITAGSTLLSLIRSNSSLENDVRALRYTWFTSPRASLCRTIWKLPGRSIC